MPSKKASQFHPKRWSAVTWLAVLLWGWYAFSLNYPPSVSYAVDPVSGELTDPTYYKSLSAIPFSVGWPLHYVKPSALAPVWPVGAPPPPLAPSVISPLAMVTNFLIILTAIGALVYLLQRFMIRYSVLTLFKVTFAFALLLGLGRLIGTLAGYRLAQWYFNAVYFSPVAAAVAVKCFRIPKVNWPMPHQGSARLAFDAYENPEDAIAAASKLDQHGDWNASIDLYHFAAGRWPEHAEYIQNCIDRVVAKQSLGHT